MSETKKKDGRSRNFATLVYPESAPENWLELLQQTAIPCFVSPLHDSDVDPDGVLKKAHYHVMLKFEGKKSPEQVREIVEIFGGVGAETVQSARGYARYMCHLDNPEKAQYKTEDVKSFAGADYFGEIGTVLDKYKAIREMRDFCKQEKIEEYCDLLDYADENRDDWFRVLCDNGSYVMKEYLKSRYYKLRGRPVR